MEYLARRGWTRSRTRSWRLGRRDSRWHADVTGPAYSDAVRVERRPEWLPLGSVAMVPIKDGVEGCREADKEEGLATGWGSFDPATRRAVKLRRAQSRGLFVDLRMEE